MNENEAFYSCTWSVLFVLRTDSMTKTRRWVFSPSAHCFSVSHTYFPLRLRFRFYSIELLNTRLQVSKDLQAHLILLIICRDHYYCSTFTVSECPFQPIIYKTPSELLLPSKDKELISEGTENMVTFVALDWTKWCISCKYLGNMERGVFIFITFSSVHTEFDPDPDRCASPRVPAEQPSQRRAV